MEFYSPDLQKCIDYWVAKGFRCPIVCDLFVKHAKGQKKFLTLDSKPPIGNYWRWDDLRITDYVTSQVSAKISKKDIYKTIKVRIYDFVGNFDASNAARQAEAGSLMYWPVSLRHGKAPGKNKPRPHVLTREHVGAATAYLPDLDAACEVLPQSLFGQTWAKVTNPKTKSTFRVVRAVSEQECKGYLDCINAYDDAAFSCGLYNWAMSGGEMLRTPDQETAPTIADIAAQPGELPGALAYWAAQFPDDAKRVLLGRYGATITPAWTKGQAGQDADNSWKGTRAYHGWMIEPGASLMRWTSFARRIGFGGSSPR